MTDWQQGFWVGLIVSSIVTNIVWWIGASWGDRR